MRWLLDSLNFNLHEESFILAEKTQSARTANYHIGRTLSNPYANIFLEEVIYGYSPSKIKSLIELLLKEFQQNLRGYYFIGRFFHEL